MPRTKDRLDHEVRWLTVSMPIELIEMLDHWIERQETRPGRPAAIRWITAQFLERERVREARKSPRRKAARRK
jgi:hypothetical protein